MKPVCKQYVLGALFECFEGKVLRFNTNEEELFLSYGAYDFRLKFKPELDILDLQFELKHNRSNMSYAKYLELSKELDEKIASIQYDFRETEAVKHWRKVHNREMQYRRK